MSTAALAGDGKLSRHSAPSSLAQHGPVNPTQSSSPSSLQNCSGISTPVKNAQRQGIHTPRSTWGTPQATRDVVRTDLPPFLAVDPPPVVPPSSARLEALYASTSAQRRINPTGYSVNAQWWAETLKETLRTGWLTGTNATASGSRTPRKVTGTYTPSLLGSIKGKGRDLSWRSGLSEMNVEELDDAGDVGGDRLVLKIDDKVVSRLSNNDSIRPRGIGGFVELQATTSPPAFHPLAHFMSSPTPLHAPPTLTYRFVGRPLWWAFSQLNPFGYSNADSSSGSNIEKEETLWKRYGTGKEYVVMALLKEAADRFTDHIESSPPLSYSESLYSTSSFRDAFGEVCFPDATNVPPGVHRLSSRDCQVLLKWLQRDSGVLVMDAKVVKLLEPGQIAAEHPVTEADRGILDIALTLRKVEEQVADLESQILLCQEKAKVHLSRGQKNLALSQLKSKKTLEEVLQKRVGVDDQLRSILRSIDQAKSDVEIMSAYETATSTLHNVLAHPSLDRDHIDKVTDSLSDAMADQAEIDDAIRSVDVVGSKASEIDEDELERELEGLINDEKESKGETKPELEGKVENPVTEPSGVSSGQHAVTADTDKERQDAADEWQKRYEDALQRRKEEAARAEDERLKPEDRRIAAE